MLASIESWNHGINQSKFYAAPHHLSRFNRRQRPITFRWPVTGLQRSRSPGQTYWRTAVGQKQT